MPRHVDRAVEVGVRDGLAGVLRRGQELAGAVRRFGQLARRDRDEPVPVPGERGQIVEHRLAEEAVGVGQVQHAELDGDEVVLARVARLPVARVPDKGHVGVARLGEVSVKPVHVVQAGRLRQRQIARMHDDRVLTEYGGDAGPSSLGYGMGWWVDRET